MNQPKQRHYLLPTMPRWLLLVVVLLGLASTPALAQVSKISGKVVDEAGSPVSGATVREKGSKRGTITDVDGNFTLAVKAGTTLTVSGIGLTEQEITAGDKLEIKMKGKNASLNEVVVTALGIRREKSQLTYSTQQVKGDDLVASKETGVLNALAGKVSGLQITSSSGAPGASSRITIRGVSSLSGSTEALIVLDGVPINNSQNGNAAGGPTTVGGISRLSDIDPATIESINVLKGSAASALYGSEAVRGVVVITTKGGAFNSKPKITFNTQASFEKPINPLLQSKYAQGDVRNGVRVYQDGESDKGSAVWGPPIDSLVRVGIVKYNKNPLDAFLTTGHTYTNTLSVSGGNDRSNYFFSYSNLEQQGTVPTTRYRRNALFAKVSNRLNEKLTLNVQVGLTLSGAHTMPEGYDLTDPLWTVITAPFTWNPYPYLDSAGNQRVFRPSRNNPIWNLYNVYNNDKTTRVIPVVSLIYKPLSWLTITERAGADTYTDRADYFEAPSTTLVTPGVVKQRAYYFMQFNNDLLAEARQKFGDFDVSLMVGSTIRTNFDQTHSLTGTGISIANFDNVSNGSVLTGSQSYNRSRKIGLYSQANVGYKGLLNLSLTGRYDGSSVLDPNKYLYPYGSASLGFIFSNLLNIPAINFGKLRASYSAVGNDNVGPYSLTTPFQSAGSFPYNGNSGFLLQTGLGNPLLKNETAKESEIGLEMSFLKSRITFEVSYFDRRNNNLLVSSVPIAPATGFTSTTLNAASMTNKGIEALVTVSPFKGKKFGWDMTFNYTRIRNKVTKINGGTQSLQIGQTWAFVGQPIGMFYNVGYARDSATHQILIDDGGLPMLSKGNVQQGNLLPDFLAGLNNSFYLGNFTFGFFFDYRKGGDIMNSDDRYGFFYGTPKATENRQDRVVPGLVASTKQVNTRMVSAESYFQRINTIYEAAMQDGTYLKLRTASIGYKLPFTYLQKTPFSAASLTLTGRNIFIDKPHFTGSDPDVSSYGTSLGSQGVYGNTIPASRSFNLTLNVVFK